MPARLLNLKALPGPGATVAPEGFRATPLELKIELDRTRTTATGWTTLTAEIRRNRVDATAPLASVSLASPTGTGPFTLAFTGAQTNQDLGGAGSAAFWLVIYASKDAGATIDVWFSGRLVLVESGASQMAAAPPNVVGPLSRAAADGLYRTLASTAMPAELIAGEFTGSALPNGSGGFFYSASTDEWGMGLRTSDGTLLQAPLFVADAIFTIAPIQIDTSSVAGRSLLTAATAAAQRTLLGLACPSYANDAAADADAALASGTFYRTTAGGRTLYRKP